MSFKPSPKQALFLFHRLFTGDEPMMSKAKPKLTPAERTELVKDGLIELEKRGGATHVVLTDKAWAWANKNPDTEISRSYAAATVLQALLSRLKAFMESRNIAMGEILASGLVGPGLGKSEEIGEKPKNGDDGPKDPAELVRNAYFKASGGKSNVRVRLAELRSLLPQMKTQELDNLLIEMQRADALVLYSLDNPKEIRPEDRQAALEISGKKRHIVYMGG